MATTKFELPPLPYSYDALAPIMSQETLHFHHDKHHAAYVNKMNELLPGSGLETAATLEEIVVKSEGKLFNNAGQHWNHDFFWKGMAPKGKAINGTALNQAIDASFGSINGMRDKFVETAVNTFGSGWAWLCKDKAGKLTILGTSNAENPLRQGLVPLITCDVWEHAYYIDYRNDRKKFVESWFQIANWEFAAKNFSDTGMDKYAQMKKA